MIKNIIGKTHGLLTVIKDSGKRRKNDGAVLWEVRCECGNTKYLVKSNFYRNKSCGCKKADVQSQSLRKSLNRGGCGEIYATHWNTVKKNAKQRKLPVKIDAKYAWNLFIKQDRRCALTGETLVFSKRCWSRDATASLDRIDSTKGYIPGNVQWVHKIVNFMKQQYTTELFFSWCKKVVEHNKL